MEKGWVKIYTCSDSFKAAIIQSMLKENSIEVIEINKKDSSYLNFGEVELYIHPSQFDEAIELIIQQEL
jgi:hypothetical protein